MIKKIVFFALLAGVLGAGVYFGRPHCLEYLARRQAESESLMVVRVIAGKDAKIEPSGYQGQIWITTAIPTKNSICLELVCTGDADSVGVGNLRFQRLYSKKPEDIRYYAQSEAAAYYLDAAKDLPETKLLLITIPLGNAGPGTFPAWSTSKPDLFETEPYKTLLKEEHGIK